jgi:hypothetical protein
LRQGIEAHSSISEEQFLSLNPGEQMHAYEEFSIPIWAHVELFLHGFGWQTFLCTCVVVAEDDEVVVDDADVSTL